MSDVADLRYDIYDVFTTTRYLGNPLAIVYLQNAESLSQEQKLKIAGEFNLSETVFMHPRQGRESQIDIFMVKRELPFAGHPTIGSAISLWNSITGSPEDAMLVTKAGPIQIQYAHDFASGLRATASIPHNVRVHKQSLSIENAFNLQPALRQHSEHIGPSPLVSIVKGMNFALVQLSSPAALESVETGHGIGPKRFVELDEGWPSGLIGTYFYFIDKKRSSSEKILASTRMIEGSLEDPATGSAACTLGSYLALEQYKSNRGTRRVDFELTQGELMGRKSDIGVTVELDDSGSIQKVCLTGSAVKVMSGTLSP